MSTPAILAFMLLAGAIAEEVPLSGSPGVGVSPAGKSDDPRTIPKGVLEINDEILITAADLDGIGDKPLRVTADGTITLPLIGKVRVVGLTPEQVEKDVAQQLAAYIRFPKVSVKRFTGYSGSIVLAGAFKNPGVYPISEPRALLDVVSMAGGLAEGAGRTIKVTRRMDRNGSPLPFGVEDPHAGLSSARISLARLIEDRDARQNIAIEPNDVLLAEPPGIVFISGEVLRPGPVQLTHRDWYGLRELIAVAGGFSKDADRNKTKILRPILNESRRAEISVDIRSVLDGSVADFRVLPNDMVVVPHSSGARRILKTTLIYIAPAAVSVSAYMVARR